MNSEQLTTDLRRITRQCALKEGETMLHVLKRLDGNACEADTPTRLKHYLSQRSYIKALAWLEDPTIPHQL